MKKTHTKKIIAGTFLALSCCTQLVSAQSTAKDSLSQEGRNLVKMNVAALITKTFSFQYERALGKRTSIAIGFRTMPKSSLPFNSKFQDLADDGDEDTRRTIRNSKISNFAITPEFRFYLGKGVFRGFYVAPFASFAKYNVESPIDVEITQLNTTESILFKGDIKTITGGVMVGAQWKLSKLVYFDWWIAGPHFGHSSGKLVGKRPLNALEQQELRNQLSDLLDDLPIIKPTYTVDGNGATVDLKGPWAGVRAGLAVGFRF